MSEWAEKKLLDKHIMRLSSHYLQNRFIFTSKKVLFLKKNSDFLNSNTCFCSRLYGMGRLEFYANNFGQITAARWSFGYQVIWITLCNDLCTYWYRNMHCIDPLKVISIKCSVCNPLASLLNRNILRISIIFSKNIYNDSVLGGWLEMG